MPKKREADPFDTPGINRASEDDAAKKYLAGFIYRSASLDQLTPILEIATACIFEYLREIYLVLSVNPEATCLPFVMDRYPFLEMSETWPKQNGIRFPSVPWIYLEEPIQKRLIELLRDGYEQVSPLDRPDIFWLKCTNVFRRFEELADKLFDDFPAIPEDQILRRLSPSLPIREGEHVVFTIDYRESAERLRQAFDGFLESRKDLLEKYAVTLNGEFYRHRLKDLAVLRLSRGGQSAFLEKNVPNAPRNASSLSESRTRALRFLRTLCGVQFQNIRDLERDVSADYRRRTSAGTPPNAS